MKTTIELPDDLYRRAKAAAALRGQKLRELVEESLRRTLEPPVSEGSGPRLDALMRDACGIVDSGISDLASNPDHLAQFGRDGLGDRSDTGPLVAFLDRREQHHPWVVDRIAELEAPLLTCEPVLAGTMFLLSRLPKAQDAVFSLFQNGALRIAFSVAEHVAELRALHRKYGDRPMSLADACIVRMAELSAHHRVFTLDSDFAIYRKHGRDLLSLVHPAYS